MENYEIPCDFKPCEASPEIDLSKLLLPTAYEPYEADVDLKKGNRLVIENQITKIPSLSVEDNVEIHIDLNNDFDYYVIVVKELNVKKVTQGHDVIVKWYVDNFNELYNKLRGSNGAHADQPRGYSKHGLPGATGEKGKTRHAPALFIFFNDVRSNRNVALKNFSFDFQLKGIPGGQGGNGGNGSDGTRGRRGRDGRPGWLHRGCRRGKNGGPGGNPGHGGRGGDGGCGGNGPEVMIYYVDEKYNEIIANSIFDVDGADPVFTPDDGQPGGWGYPGIAGTEGKGGEGGRRGGNCRGGHDGRDGLPKSGSGPWQNWNLGHGLPGTYGLAGGFDYDPIDDEVLKVVFNDPMSNPQSGNRQGKA